MIKSTYVFKFLNLFALLGYLLSIIGMLTGYYTDFADIMNAIFNLFLLAGLLFIELVQKPFIHKHFTFMFTFAGRGIFYIWLAWTSFRNEVVTIIGTIFTCVIGLIYVVFFLIKNIHIPQNMLDDEIYSGGSDLFLPDEDEGLLPSHEVSDRNRSGYLPIKTTSE